MIPHCIHESPDTKTDDKLQKESAHHLNQNPAIQCIAELLAHLRNANRSWWSAKQTCKRFPIRARFMALTDRPDIRRDVLLALFDKLPSQTMREISLAFQIDLLEKSLANNEITAYGVEHAFNTYHLALYMNAEEWWNAFRDALPESSDDADDREVLRYLFERLLADREGRTPILRPLDLLVAIDARAWHGHLPLDLRAEVHQALLAAEQQGEPFTAADVLKITTLEDITRHVPIRHLLGVLDAAERTMGIAKDGNGAKDPDIIVANELSHEPVFESTPPKA